MALDPANYIDELSITDPTASDLVSQKAMTDSDKNLQNFS